MEELIESHPFAVAIVVGVSGAAASVMLCHVVVWAWDRLSDFSLREALRGLFHRNPNKGCPGADCHAFDAARERLRAKLLAGGYGKHKAYHIARYGLVLVADAADYYLALFTGMDDFWDYVALGHIGEPDGGFLTAPLDQIDFGDGKGAYACIHAARGDTFVDSGILPDLTNTYLCTRATAYEFKDAIVKRQAEAADCGEVDECLQFHGAHFTKTA